MQSNDKKNKKIEEALEKAHKEKGHDTYLRTRQELHSEVAQAHRGLMHMGYAAPNFIQSAKAAHQAGDISDESFKKYQELNDANNGAKHSWKRK